MLATKQKKYLVGKSSLSNQEFEFLLFMTHLSSAKHAMIHTGCLPLKSLLCGGTNTILGLVPVREFNPFSIIILVAKIQVLAST